MNTMANHRQAFVMQLYPGMAAEYQKRHDNLWQEMQDMIHAHGGGNYSIFLNPETNQLFGYIELENPQLWSKTAETEICRKWWAYMADIMETNPDNSPVQTGLPEVFHLE